MMTAVPSAERVELSRQYAKLCDAEQPIDLMHSPASPAMVDVNRNGHVTSTTRPPCARVTHDRHDLDVALRLVKSAA